MTPMLLTNVRSIRARFGYLNHLIVAILLSFCCAVELPAEQSKIDSVELFSIKVLGKYGFIKSDGTLIIKPSFDRVHEFKENLAYVEQDGRHFFIDENGHEVFGVTGVAESFSQGLSLVKASQNGMYGFVDRSGKFSIQPKFLSGSNFSEGLAAVRIAKDRSFYIEKNGELAFPGIEFESCGDFHNGFAVVGKRIEEQKYVKIPNSKASRLITGIRFGVIDRNGRLVVPFSYLKLGDCEETLLFKFLDGKSELASLGQGGYIDKSGKVVIPAQFDETGKFSEGLLPVKRDPKGLFGAVDSSGRIVLSERYLELRNFSDGLAGFASSAGKFGFVDRLGTVVIAAKYDFVGDFRSGLAYCRIGNQEGYVAKDGRQYLSGDYLK